MNHVCRTYEQLMLMPNAIVAITILSDDGFVNCVNYLGLYMGAMCVYIYISIT